MLVLGRNVGEEIRIGRDITITVVEARAGRIQLGVTGPRNIRVLRTELIGKEQEAARWGTYAGQGAYVGTPMCRECVVEYEPTARFEGDDPTTWDVDDRNEPEGTLYLLLPFPEQAPCGNCLPIP